MREYTFIIDDVGIQDVETVRILAEFSIQLLNGKWSCYNLDTKRKVKIPVANSLTT